MDNKPIFQQTAIDFEKGLVRIKKNFWAEVWHVSDMNKRTVSPGKQPEHFQTAAEAERWAEAQGYKVKW